MSEQHIRFRDIKPYEAPDSLDDLQGPYVGQIQLQHTVWWVPGDRIIDLKSVGQRHMAYQALLAEGRVTDQLAGLNAQRLIEDWTELHLDVRVRELWQSRFPELSYCREQPTTV
ncbi:hypothetical protein KIMH_13350 [Bombiscardovia apis]|uniref:Transcriptional regulator n=1 Tax=Bombiscardovia apis TaxID=2932182 RepID=A0ABM8BE98_9BIFI|nr:hypothetical protein [Bombiscardovia apis]BDR55224.1 hypothetical protein KIMH_13350 [Bombiscardovia apis]